MTDALESAGRPARVLAYERHDPRDGSLQWLREQGIEVHYGSAQTDPAFRRYTDEMIAEQARGFDAVIGSSSAHFPQQVLQALPQLRCISKFGIGVDTIDVETATRQGVLVSNTPESLGVIAVAEHAIGMMLALKKRLDQWTPSYLQAGHWRRNEHAGMVQGQTVGIVGFGRIGRAVAARLQGWGVQLLAYDPYPGAPVEGVQYVDLDTLLGQSDIVTLHCGATADNHHLINAQALARMKQGALLINTGRGSLVDTDALEQSLVSGHLGGAGLDVYEQEPPDPQQRLFTLPHVLTTPHAAAWALEVFLGRRWQAARNLRAMLAGEPCQDVVNPAALAHPGRLRFDMATASAT